MNFLVEMQKQERRNNENEETNGGALINIICSRMAGDRDVTGIWGTMGANDYYNKTSSSTAVFCYCIYFSPETTNIVE